jgi:hypothetical protein
MTKSAGTRLRACIEGMIIAYVDPNMPTLLRQCKRKALNGWTADVSIHRVREVVLALMYEWEQTVEDTTTAPGL